MITEQQIFEAHERVERATAALREATRGVFKAESDLLEAKTSLRELRQKEREQVERQIVEAKADKCRENAEAVGPQKARWA